MKRLTYIDSLRGLASIIVALFWHYKHFSSVLQPNSVGQYPPLYWLFPARFFFDHGDTMVDFFFVLSGVIFSYTYRTSIKQSTTGVYDFFVKRFSRLYPIHLLTLIVVAILVRIYYIKTSSFPIYGLNDTYHFLLNLLFLQKGFFDKGYSFNAPAWSLSIEAFMYILFFLQARYWNTLYSSILFIIIGFFIYRLNYDFPFLINHPVARGLMGFFSGCLLYELLMKNNIYRKYRYIILVATGILISIYVGYIKDRVNISPHLLMIFVAIILIAESHHNHPIKLVLENRFFKILGDISLSLYLIHVPVQILILLYFRINGLTIVYDNSLLFVFYGLSVLIIGFILHYTIEIPIQSWLRQKLKRKLISPQPTTSGNVFTRE